MGILVAFFTWVYVRERQQRVALWMLAWVAIAVHFAFELASGFSLLPEAVCDWMAGVSLLTAAGCFFRSVSPVCSTPLQCSVFFAGLAAPAVAYYSSWMFSLRPALLFPGLLVLFGGSAVVLAVLSRRAGGRHAWWLIALIPFAAVVYTSADHPEYGMDLIFCTAFWAAAVCWWLHFHQWRPGVVLAGLSFLAWGAVFPVSTAVRTLGLDIPPGHVVWDLPKYFVAFGMIVTLFENQTAALQREVAERKRAEEAARTADHAKSMYLAAISHEIRTPMNGIAGLASVLMESPSTTEQRLDLGLLKSSADSLLRVVNDILDFSKIEAGKFVVESIPFNLHAQIGEVLADTAIRAHQKGLELICDVEDHVPEQIVGDPLRLRQILSNLLSNAVKFTLSGEIVLTIGAEPDGERSARLHFQVRDTGIGVPADRRESIFEAFAQGDDSISRRFGGTGLGLAICARLAAMMQGRAWVEPGPEGEGSVFHCVVRAGVADAPLRAVAREPLPESRRRRPALLVDDNATARRVLAKALAGWGIRTEEASSGEAALDWIAARRDAGEGYGLILVDSQMPDLDGFDTVERMRRKLGVGSPVLMMVPALSTADLARSKSQKISGTVRKPVQKAELYHAIARIPEHAPERKMLHAQRVEADRARPQLRVLLAEDNALNRLVAVRLLEREGHRVVVAVNGKEAVEAFERESFDVILMDVQMPEMDGLEATVAIRQAEKPAGRHTPIIAVTAHAMKGDEGLCLKAGMDAYLSKPLDIARLLELIVTLARKNTFDRPAAEQTERAARAAAGSPSA